jgi:hypothetical protein
MEFLNDLFLELERSYRLSHFHSISLAWRLPEGLRSLSCQVREEFRKERELTPAQERVAFRSPHSCPSGHAIGLAHTGNLGHS